MNSYIDANQVRRALATIHPDGELFEIRIIQERGILSGYFKDVDQAVDAISRLSTYDLRGANVYTTLNPVLDACFSRSQSNKIIKTKTNTKDNEITRLKWLFIDLDPVRVAGISSSQEELEKAKERAVNVYRYLKKEGFPEPLIGMSGNGYHLLYRIDLAVKKADTIKTFLEAIGMLFTDDDIKIDAVNFNPSRICKLYGTLAQKGAGTEERPHRIAYVIQAPEVFEITSLEDIEKIAAMLPKKEEKKKTRYQSTNSGPAFDIVEWMARHGIEYKSVVQGDGYTKYILKKCPFNDAHAEKSETMVTKGDNGAVGFRCLHNGCIDKTWRDFRQFYEPDAYDKKEEGEDDGRIDAGWTEHKKMVARTRANEEGNNAGETAGEIEDVLTLATEEPPKKTFRKLKSAAELMKKELPVTRTLWGGDGTTALLKKGTCILSAKPKLGKSWLAMCLCLAAANGADFLGHKTEKCSSLYLDLESGEDLQQERLIDILKANPEWEPGLNKFYLESDQIDRVGMGLEQQIEGYLEQDPDIGIVVIDVFQGVRSAAASFKENEYDHSYRDIKPLEAFAQKHNIAIILVMHNRKTVDPDNPFDNILGSVGNQAAVSGMMVMYQQRDGDPIHIAIKGRRIKGRQDLDTVFKDGAWELVEGGNSADREKERLLQEYMNSPIRKAVQAIVDAKYVWKGRCGEIIDTAVQLGIPITETPKALGGFLHKHQSRFLEQDGIRLQFISNGTGSKIYKIERYDPEREKDLAMLEKEGFVEL